MIVGTRKTDQHARIILPEVFAGETVVIERIGPNELRLRKKKTLTQLLAEIKPENLHDEWDTGADVGEEIME